MYSIKDGVARLSLTTTGRRTGMDHTVMLRAVLYMGEYYFSRHRPDSDWFLNALSNPIVTISHKDISTKGMAVWLHDVPLESHISELKYPGEPRAKDRRAILRVTPLRECE